MTWTDFIPALLERGRARAVAEGQRVTFSEADANALPFADGDFHAVLSTFGVMFTTSQDRAAADVLRVCRSGGKMSWQTGRPVVSSVRSSRPAAAMPPARRAPPGQWSHPPGWRNCSNIQVS